MRAAPGEPAAVGRAHQAQHRQALGGAGGDQPQRPAGGLELERQPVGRGLEVDEPRREPVVAGRAALAERVERDVGGVGCRARRLERIRTPGDRHLVGIPGATGEDAGRDRHPTHGTWGSAVTCPRSSTRSEQLRSAPVARRSSTGDGGTRTSSPRPGASRRCGVPVRPARVRVARSRAARAAVGRVAAGAAPAAARTARGDLRDRATTSARSTAYGRSYADIVRAFRGRFDHPPDVVALPRNEERVAGRARLGAVGRRGRDPVRWRHERGRRRRGGRLRAIRRAS